MNKQTKMILGVAAVGVAAYFIYNSMRPKTASFVRATRRTRTSSCGSLGDCEGPTANLCGDSCVAGICYYPVYDERGGVSYRTAKCGGQFGTGV